jgi:hypothetical protein
MSVLIGLQRPRLSANAEVGRRNRLDERRFPVNSEIPSGVPAACREVQSGARVNFRRVPRR